MTGMRATHQAAAAGSGASKGRIALAAGGTGGHVLPALAVGEILHRRGWTVQLMTDARGAVIPSDARAWGTTVIDGGRLTGGLTVKSAAAVRLAANLVRSIRALGRLRPDLVIGFGGYPALPALLSARLRGLPYVVHEQNAVLGRVNRLLAKRAAALALSFFTTSRVPAGLVTPPVMTGLPLRQGVLDRLEQAPEAGTRATLHLLVVGGSQGARILSTVVPEAVAELDSAVRERLVITQQCRPEDVERVRARYHALGLAPELATYFDDLPARMADADLLVARAGASTLAEAAALGRPALLVPLAIATDDHQSANAAGLCRAGGAWAMPEPEFTAAALSARLSALLTAPASLTAAGAAAATLARPRAADHVADLAEAVIAGHPLPREVAP